MSNLLPHRDELPDVNLTRQPTPRSARLVTSVVGAALGAVSLVAGLVVGLLLWVDASSYRYWPSDSRVVGGQGPSEVTVEAGEPFLLWKDASFDTPECVVAEVPSGKVVVLTDVTGQGWERGGGAVPHVAFAEGRSATSRISVSCAAAPGSSYDSGPETYVVDAVNGPRFVDWAGPWWPAPMALLASGVILFLLAASARPRRQRSR